MSDALVAVIAASGGEVHLETEVLGILVEQGRAAGIEIAGGGQVRAPLVFSAVSPRSTMLDLVGARHVE